MFSSVRRFQYSFVIAFWLLACGLAFSQCPHAGQNIGSAPYPAGGPYLGTSFRVWAPHASAVHVSGDFNNWSNTASPLVNENYNGFWCADVAGATIKQQYLYVIDSPGFGTVTRRDPNSRVVTAANNGKSIIYDPTVFAWHDKSFARPPLNKLAIYEMDIVAFNATQQSSGTFQSAIAQLSQISSLGFNAVELLPVTQFNGVHGNPYGPTDQDAIDNPYEGPDGLKAFVDACHQQGLAVIMDVVHNHWGPFQIPTFQFDGWTDSNHPGGIYFYDSVVATGDRYDSPYGPRPDFSNPVANYYITSQIGMWFNEYHADGLRWDSVSNIYNAWGGGLGKNPHTGKPGVFLPDGINLLRNTNTSVSKNWPGAFLIAEDLSLNAKMGLVTTPISGGGLGFDSQWNATLAYFLRKDFPSGNAINLSDVVSGMTSTFNGDYLQSIAYVESHNELTKANSRLYQLVDPQNPTSRTARKKAALAASILFTSPQVPMIYQGDEFLDPSWLDNKTPLNWQNAQTWSGIRALYGALVGLRVNAAGTSAGLSDPDLNIYQKDKTSNVLVYDRYNQANPGQDDVIVVANLSGSVLSDYQIGLPYGGTWQFLYNSDSTSYSSDFGNIGPVGSITAVNVPFGGQPYSATVPIGDYSVLIFSRNSNHQGH